MKKSFKFSAILLALITSASGLAPVGAIPPVKPNAESKEKTTENPQKRAREDENSEEAVPEKRFEREKEVIPQTPYTQEAMPQTPYAQETIQHIQIAIPSIAGVAKSIQTIIPPAQTMIPYAQPLVVRPAQAAAVPYAQAAALVPSKQERELMEIKSQLYDFEKKHKKIMDEECYILDLARSLVTGRTCKICFMSYGSLIVNLREVRDKYYQNTDKFSSDIKKCLDTMDRELFHLIDIKPNQLTALSLFTMMSSLQRKHEGVIHYHSNSSDDCFSGLMYLLAISEFNKNAASELGTDVPPEEFDFDTVDIYYDTSNMTMKISFYNGIGTQKVYESTL